MPIPDGYYIDPYSSSLWQKGNVIYDRDTDRAGDVLSNSYEFPGSNPTPLHDVLWDGDIEVTRGVDPSKTGYAVLTPRPQRR